MQTVVVWFRTDLRLSDHPALTAALQEADTVIPLYIHAPAEAAPWSPGAASDWWLHHSLAALDADLHARGARLVIARGDSATVLARLCSEHNAHAVHATRLYEPAPAARDRRVTEDLAARGIALLLHAGATLLPPEHMLKSDGTPFRVFTPFWRRLQERCAPQAPLPAPATIPMPADGIASLRLDELGLLPRRDWDRGFYGRWSPGERQAHHRLAEFARTALADYAHGRDLPALAGTSRLSPHLHFGELSPRQAWRELAGGGAAGALETRGTEAWLRELGWREFAQHVLHHFPHTSDAPMDARFERFPWRRDGGALLRAWRRGQTGIPIVDAGMRELWHTGWMHNRVRMLAASLLTKNCLVAWQEGARWFWDTLVDADLASNSLGWQWTAGCGVDAAPWFRIFNPVLQGEKFDPQGDYVRRWVPELAALDTGYIHRPWTAPPAMLAACGITLGDTYPLPIVDLAASRAEALAVYKSMGTDFKSVPIPTP
ncbi:MAG: deoxyribodipyrimidine photo-lyase [Gammaproteobacteria bacterium]|nr:deoxyribodipyrimidine photo-lyase [Gammaproteobacteria bacterium]